MTDSGNSSLNNLVNTPDNESYSMLQRPTSRGSLFVGDGTAADKEAARNAAVAGRRSSPSRQASGIEHLESVARAARYYDRLDHLLDQLEFRVDNIQQMNKRSRRFSNGAVAVYHSDVSDEEADKTEEEESDSHSRTHSSVELTTPRTVPEVREYDWEHFVNRFSPLEHTYAIETLVAGPKLVQDVADEAARRGPFDIPFGSPRPAHRPVNRQVHSTEGNARWIQRVRIQSEALLGVFSKVTGCEWGTKPLSFIRPFQYLLHYHEQFKEEHRRMESEVDSIKESQERDNSSAATDESNARTLRAEVSSPGTLDSGNDDQSQPTPSDKDDQTSEAHLKSAAVLEDLRCYLNFVEEKLLPDYKRFQEANHSVRPKIRFDDLWYLFRPGDLIFVPPKTLKKSTERRIKSLGVPVENMSHESSMHQKIWRLHFGQTPWQEISPSVTEPLPTDSFEALCYYLDYDGSSYGGVQARFQIYYFEGEKDVRELDFYPLRFAQGGNELLREARNLGRMFSEYVSQWHLSYNGWTFVTDPMGIPILDFENYSAREARQKRPEHIEGNVIVDFREAFNSYPLYKNTFADEEPLTDPQNLGDTMDSPYQIMVWSDPRRSRLITRISEAIVTSFDCELQEHDSFLQKNPYLRQSTWPKLPPEGDDLALLPPRLFVYALRQRKFVPVDVRYLKLNPVQEDAIQHLQLPDDHKRVIQAAVHSHLRRKRIERNIESSKGVDVRTQDFIMGKGRGLLVMLHGEPGVGKTATAEAVAQSTERPLFPISCSDLAERWSVEERLDEIFRLAHLWDCVLLLDEADVFLAARSLSGSNTLVSSKSSLPTSQVYACLRARRDVF
jgi:ATPase family associated with various cellular activities (AAA)